MITYHNTICKKTILKYHYKIKNFRFKLDKAYLLVL